MRDLLKSAMTLPWAISMFGVQQMSNLMGPPTNARIAGATQAMDTVSDVTAESLDGWLKQTYKVTTSIQRMLVDLMMLKPPEFDQSTLMHMAAEMQDGPFFNAMVKYGVPPVGWLDSFLVSSKDAGPTLQEFRNKIEIILLVTHVHAELGLDANTIDPLSVLVERIYAMPTFPRIWATEGLGNWYGDVCMKKASGGPDPVGMLTDKQYDSLPPWTWTMLHAGIGMSFGKSVLVKMNPTSPKEVIREQLARFVRLCKDNSRQGYAGAALESLGLATRTLYPNMLLVLDAEIPAVAPDLHGYYWHGAGRAMYFEPMGMLPSVNAPWRVIRRLDQEAPHDLARRNILSGVGWALSIVNMRQPIVMETFLRHHASLLQMNDAFTNGVISSMMMRYDTSRDDAYIDPYLRYQTTDPDVQRAFSQLVAAPCQIARDKTYSELVATKSLEHLFHYRPVTS